MAATAGRKKPTIAARRIKFLKKLAVTANVSASARAAGISKSALYDHRARHSGFAKAWDEAIGEALDELEQAVIDRAKDGVEKPVFFGGNQIGTVRSYSDALAMFLLRARRPEVYARLSGDLLASAGDDDAAARAEVLRRIEQLGTPTSDDAEPPH
ncbi:MAG: terminase [Sphingomonas sp.]|nr:terminase [Sphingomonas sp.]